MSNDEITIRLPRDLADAYRRASEVDRRKMDVLISAELRDFLHSTLSLEDAMNTMSDEAARNGMTPEILESILRNEG